MSSSSSSAFAGVGSTSASSVAALTHSFDFDLHLEGDKPKGQVLQGRSYIFCVAIILGLVSSLWYRSPRKTSAQMVQPLAEMIIPNPVDLAKELNDRLKKTKDLNELIASRINILNDTVSSLRSRVLQIEKRPILTNPENFTSTRIDINNRFLALADHMRIQSEKIDNTTEVQKTAASALQALKTTVSSKVSQLPATIKTVEENLARLNVRVEEFSVKETEAKKAKMASEAIKAKMLAEASKAKLESEASKAKMLTESSKAKIEASDARLESEERQKRLESQNLQYLQKISKLEEKFATTLKNAGKAFAHMRADLNLTAAAESNKWDGITDGIVSEIFVEGIVRNVWNENKKIYQNKLPDLACPKSVTVVDKIVEIIVEKEVEKKVVEAVINTPDFARRQAGAKIISEGTSETFLHPDMNFRQFSKSVFKQLGVSSDSTIANSAMISQIGDIADFFVPSLVRILGLDSGIGRPEDAISADMGLGSCWPMQVRQRNKTTRRGREKERYKS